MDPFVNAAMVLADPAGITPDYSYFPFMATLNKIAAGFEGMALIVCVILLVAAAILFGASKLTSSPAAARVTGTVFIVCIVLAAVIAGAGGLISWATGIPLV
uniref:hypothetical protein n=1 Tax=Bifidobacterium adolescentis TaxID=1680 RepID=UPI00359C75AF